LYIRNTSQLLPSDLNDAQLNLRKIALEAIEKSITAVRPKRLIEKSIKVIGNTLIIQNDEYDLAHFSKAYIVGGGKATAEMAFMLEKILLKSKSITCEGIINVLQGVTNPEQIVKSNISINYASHPIPNKSGLNGVKKMIDMIDNSNEKDLIFCLISGGGSALLPLPKKKISLNDLQQINSLLLASGASIQEINTIRKHLSDFKGGNLAKRLFNSSKATLISIIISDVVGDNLDTIASGPTVPDSTTFKDACEILKKYEIIKRIPSSIRTLLENGLKGIEMENPKQGDDCFNKVHNYLIGTIKSAVDEITPFLDKHNFEVKNFSNEVVGEAKDYGKSLYALISHTIDDKAFRDSTFKIALIGSGELTVTISGMGKGGRNQEMILGFLDHIKDFDLNYDFLIVGCNLDGIEGNSQAMGALADNLVLNQMKNSNLNPKIFLDNNDSNSFFQSLKCEIITGLTGCNVNDLLLILILR
jgi:hydroxypyruvate reductase/glycerate 2-kinase